MADDKSVTVVVTRRVIAGQEEKYRQWFREVSERSAKFPGHLGATLQGPTDNNDFHVIFRYDTVEHLRAWEQSEERAHWTAKLAGVVQGEAKVDKYCGLEFLFDSSGPPVPKYRMVIVLTAVVFLMLLALRPLSARLFEAVPPSLQLLITVTVQVIAMTYLVMPLIYRWLGRWLRS
jgi:antibiotic biosynthesis monooxygenase (ABM) superfamily enzyme